MLPIPRPILLHDIQLYDLRASIGLRRTVVVDFPCCALSKQPSTRTGSSTDTWQLLFGLCKVLYDALTRRKPLQINCIMSHVHQ